MKPSVRVSCSSAASWQLPSSAPIKGAVVRQHCAPLQGHLWGDVSTRHGAPGHQHGGEASIICLLITVHPKALQWSGQSGCLVGGGAGGVAMTSQWASCWWWWWCWPGGGMMSPQAVSLVNSSRLWRCPYSSPALPPAATPLFICQCLAVRWMVDSCLRSSLHHPATHQHLILEWTIQCIGWVWFSLHLHN